MATLVMLFEGDVPGFRQVFLDGRGHTRNQNPTWQGHSIGRWGGDTLVVDTVGFNDRTWLSPSCPSRTLGRQDSSRPRSFAVAAWRVDSRMLNGRLTERLWKPRRLRPAARRRAEQCGRRVERIGDRESPCRSSPRRD